MSLKIDHILKFESEPYRYLFPLGAISAFWGLGIWILFQLGLLSFYPRVNHGMIMFFALFWSFITGFLMTAVPKMTGTIKAQTYEIVITMGLIMTQLIASTLPEHSYSVFILLLQALWMVTFLVKRFLQKFKIPFWGFVFVPAAFMMSFAGSLLYFVTSNNSYLFSIAGEAFVLNLILGLGGRLVPAITRVPQAQLPTDPHENKSFYLSLSTAILLNLSFFIENFVNVNFGQILKTIITFFSIVYFLKLFKKPVQFSFIGLGLKISLVGILLGSILQVPFFGLGLAGSHVLYILGFLLITVMISFRVMLAHGGQTLDYEVQSKRILAIVSLMGLATISRFLAFNQVTSYYVFISAMILIIAMFLWLFKFSMILIQSE